MPYEEEENHSVSDAEGSQSRQSVKYGHEPRWILN
jgi:hypothetical protein